MKIRDFQIHHYKITTVYFSFSIYFLTNLLIKLLLLFPKPHVQFLLFIILIYLNESLIICIGIVS